jgi:hypothetical protein
MLSAIPVDQHDLPPELQDAAAGLANLIALDCPGGGASLDAGPAGTVAVADSAPPEAEPPVPGVAPQPPAAQSGMPSVGTLTAADIAAASDGTPPPPAAPPSQSVVAPQPPSPAPEAPATPTLVIASEDRAPGGAPPAVAVATGESNAVKIGALALGALLLAGLGAALFFLQRNLRRAR